MIRGWTHRVFPIGDASRVGEVRRHANLLAADMGWSDGDIGRAGLVATELATNLVRHAHHGEVWIAARMFFQDIEIICVDRGPGIADIAHSMRDGISTGSGSPGTGLGAIARTADDFDMVSGPAGTVSLARIRKTGARRPALGGLLGAVCLALPSETLSGDAWAAMVDAGQTDILVVDGLGHGPLAAFAAQAAIDVFQEHSYATLDTLLSRAHAALRSTRGAALLAVRASETMVQACGAGNIAGKLFNGLSENSLIVQYGTVGIEIANPRINSYRFPQHGALILHSDGVSARWKAADYTHLLGKDPTLLSACILWSHTRRRDDATVVVLKAKEEK